jgi:hypothetical protein
MNDLVKPDVTPASLLQMAVAQNADIDKLTKLMDLQERWEANEARKAYVKAMTEFKGKQTLIHKNKKVEFGNTKYNHASLDEVVVSISENLSACGLSHAWSINQSGDTITVSCTLTHTQGHAQSVLLSTIADKSGSKNPIQAVGSAVTYLQRYTLLAVTGCATTDNDDDGKGAHPKENITPEQVAILYNLIMVIGVDKNKFLKYLNVQELDLLPADMYQTALTALESKKTAVAQEKAKIEATKIVEEFHKIAIAKEPDKELSEADKKFYQE